MAHHITKLSELSKELNKALEEGFKPEVYRERFKAPIEFIREPKAPFHERLIMALRHLPLFIKAVLDGKPSYNYGLAVEPGKYLSNYTLETCVTDFMIDYADKVFNENGFHDKSDEYIKRVLDQRYTDRSSFADAIIFYGRDFKLQLEALAAASIIEDVKPHLHIDHAAMTTELLKRARKHAKNIVAVMDYIC